MSAASTRNPQIQQQPHNVELTNYQVGVAIVAGLSAGFAGQAVYFALPSWLFPRDNTVTVDADGSCNYIEEIVAGHDVISRTFDPWVFAGGPPTFLTLPAGPPKTKTTAYPGTRVTKVELTPRYKWKTAVAIVFNIAFGFSITFWRIKSLKKRLNQNVNNPAPQRTPVYLAVWYMLWSTVFFLPRCLSYILRTIGSYILPARWFVGRRPFPTPQPIEAKPAQSLVSQSDLQQTESRTLNVSDPTFNSLHLNPWKVQQATPVKLVHRHRVYDKLGNEVYRPTNPRPLPPRKPLASILDSSRIISFDSTGLLEPVAISSAHNAPPSGLLRDAPVDLDATHPSESWPSFDINFFEDQPAPKSALAKHFTPRLSLFGSRAKDSVNRNHPILKAPSPLNPRVYLETVGTLQRGSGAILSSPVTSSWGPTPGVAPDWPSPLTSTPIRAMGAKSAVSGPNASPLSRLAAMNPVDKHSEDILAPASFITDVDHLVESPVSFTKPFSERFSPFDSFRENSDCLTPPSVVDESKMAFKYHHTFLEDSVASPRKEVILDTNSTPPSLEDPVLDESHEEACSSSSAPNDFFNPAIHPDHSGCPLLQLEKTDLVMFSTSSPIIETILEDKHDCGPPTVPTLRLPGSASSRAIIIVEAAIPSFSSEIVTAAAEALESIQAPSMPLQTIVAEEASERDSTLNEPSSINTFASPIVEQQSTRVFLPVPSSITASTSAKSGIVTSLSIGSIRISAAKSESSVQYLSIGGFISVSPTPQAASETEGLPACSQEPIDETQGASLVIPAPVITRATTSTTDHEPTCEALRPLPSATSTSNVEQPRFESPPPAERISPRLEVVVVCDILVQSVIEEEVTTICEETVISPQEGPVASSLLPEEVLPAPTVALIIPTTEPSEERTLEVVNPYSSEEAEPISLATDGAEVAIQHGEKPITAVELNENEESSPPVEVIEDVTLSSAEAGSSDAPAVTPQLTETETVLPKTPSTLRAEATPFDPFKRVIICVDVEASETPKSDSEVILSPANVAPEGVELPKYEEASAPTISDLVYPTDRLDDVKAELITDVSEKPTDAQLPSQVATEPLEEKQKDGGALSIDTKECPPVNSPSEQDVPTTVDSTEVAPPVVEDTVTEPLESYTPKVTTDAPQPPPRATLHDSIWAVKESVEEQVKDSPVIAAISVSLHGVQESATETAVRVSSAPSHCETIREERVESETKPLRQAPQRRSLGDSIWADKESVGGLREALDVPAQKPQSKSDAGDKRSIYASMWATDDTKESPSVMPLPGRKTAKRGTADRASPVSTIEKEPKSTAKRVTVQEAPVEVLRVSSPSLLREVDVKNQARTSDSKDSKSPDVTQEAEALRQATRGNSLRDSIWAIKEGAGEDPVASEPLPRARAVAKVVKDDRSLSASMWATPSQDRKGLPAKVVSVSVVPDVGAQAMDKGTAPTCSTPSTQTPSKPPVVAARETKSRATLQDSIWAVKERKENSARDSQSSGSTSTTSSYDRRKSEPSQRLSKPLTPLRDKTNVPEATPASKLTAGSHGKEVPRTARGSSLSDSMWAVKEAKDIPSDGPPCTPPSKTGTGDERSLQSSMWATRDGKECLPKAVVPPKSPAVSARTGGAEVVSAVVTQKAILDTSSLSKSSPVPSTPVRKATPKVTIYESMWAVREAAEQPVEDTPPDSTSLISRERKESVVHASSPTLDCPAKAAIKSADSGSNQEMSGTSASMWAPKPTEALPVDRKATPTRPVGPRSLPSPPTTQKQSQLSSQSPTTHIHSLQGGSSSSTLVKSTPISNPPTSSVVSPYRPPKSSSASTESSNWRSNAKPPNAFPPSPPDHTIVETSSASKGKNPVRFGGVWESMHAVKPAADAFSSLNERLDSLSRSSSLKSHTESPNASSSTTPPVIEFSTPRYGPSRSPEGPSINGVWSSMRTSQKTPSSSPMKGISDTSNWRSPYPGDSQQSQQDDQGSFHSFDATLVSDIIMGDAKFTPPKAQSSPRTFGGQPQHQGIPTTVDSPAFFPSGVAASSISAFPLIQKTAEPDVAPMDIVELTPPKAQAPPQMRRNVQIEPLQYQQSGNFGTVNHHPHPQPTAPRQNASFRSRPLPTPPCPLIAQQFAHLQPSPPWPKSNHFAVPQNTEMRVTRDATVDRLRVGLAARLLSKEMQCHPLPSGWALQARSGATMGAADDSEMQLDVEPDHQEQEKKWRKTRRGCRAGVGVRRKLEERAMLRAGLDYEGDVEMDLQVMQIRGRAHARSRAEKQRDYDDVMNVDPPEDEGSPSSHGKVAIGARKRRRGRHGYVTGYYFQKRLLEQQQTMVAAAA